MSLRESIGSMGLGCWAFGQAGWGQQPDDVSMAALAAAVAAGLKHFDTAQAYGRGHSEEVVGRALAPHRQDVFLATKLHTAPDPQRILASVDQSLERLGTECVDLCYIHWPAAKGGDNRPTMEALMRAKAQGKIHHIGVSNFSVAQMQQAMEVGPVDAHQLCYSLYWRFPEREIIPFCNAHNIAVVTYSSLCQGILTGKFPPHPEFPPGDQRPHTVMFQSEVWPRVYAATEELKGLAAEAGRPLTDLALHWVTAQQGVDCVLVGARNPEQVARNLDAMAGDIPSDILQRMTPIGTEVFSSIPEDVPNYFNWYRD